MSGPCQWLPDFAVWRLPSPFLPLPSTSFQSRLLRLLPPQSCMRSSLYSSISSLAFSCWYPGVIDFSCSWSEFRPYRPAAESHCGKPSHLQMWGLAFANNRLKADEVSSHSFKGHITLEYRVKCIFQVVDLHRSLLGLLIPTQRWFCTFPRLLCQLWKTFLDFT